MYCRVTVAYESNARLAQRLERRASRRLVAGSSPGKGMWGGGRGVALRCVRLVPVPGRAFLRMRACARVRVCGVERVRKGWCSVGSAQSTVDSINQACAETQLFSGRPHPADDALGHAVGLVHGVSSRSSGAIRLVPSSSVAAPSGRRVSGGQKGEQPASHGVQ